MDKIQIGEYVRTKYYGIKRIDTIFENRPVNRYGYEIGSDWDGKEYSIIKTTEIVKHSKNIIDLIENKDILKVKTKENEIMMIGLDENTTDVKYKELKEEIENKEYELLEILTHEQYENNCYTL